MVAGLSSSAFNSSSEWPEEDEDEAGEYFSSYSIRSDVISLILFGSSNTDKRSVLFSNIESKNSGLHSSSWKEKENGMELEELAKPRVVDFSVLNFLSFISLRETGFPFRNTKPPPGDFNQSVFVYLHTKSLRRRKTDLLLEMNERNGLTKVSQLFDHAKVTFLFWKFLQQKHQHRSNSATCQSSCFYLDVELTVAP